jgi:hypothetical protein
MRSDQPDIPTGDLPHTAGNKAILAGIGAMIKLPAEFELATQNQVSKM